MAGRLAAVNGPHRCLSQALKTGIDLHYSTDDGQTVKVAYAFGRNPNFRDDGTPGGGKTGSLLGNADNRV